MSEPTIHTAVERYWQECAEKLARSLCMSEFGGYPLDRAELEAWPSWRCALEAAQVVMKFKRDGASPSPLSSEGK